MDKHLHIITHDVPWPVDYGGVVDLFYKIKALHAQGIKIHLHCFRYGREAQEELSKYCISVHYYPRKKHLAGISFVYPYIVYSRRDKNLLKRLQMDNHPVLMEGIHCTYLLKKGTLGNRKILVRLHNVEYKYYRQLARHENNILKKIYYAAESFLLYRYEKSVSTKTTFVAVSAQDMETYRSAFHAPDIQYLPVFIPWKKITSHTGKGYFCLYHGNLSVSENEKAADWLLNNVFDSIDIPLVIAGRNPSLPLQTLSHSRSHTCITSNPTEAEMQDMIQKAQVNILPSFNQTGVKLKLLNALYNGRHCLVNAAGVKGTGLEALCHIAATAEEFKTLASRLFDLPFTEELLAERKRMLEPVFDNEKNARQLIKWLY